MADLPRYGVLFDVNKTLINSNYLHVVAWWHAFRAHGHTPSMTQLHRTVGQGSDRFVESILGRRDDDLSAAHTDFYGPFLREVPAFPASRDLLRATSNAGLTVVLATSASTKEATHLLKAIDADDVIDSLTTKDDVQESKPDPDVITSAMRKAALDAEHCLFVGDTVWDVEAARRAGLGCVGVLSGGISAGEMSDAGAVAIYRDVAHLLEKFDASPLGALAKRASAGQ